MASANRSKFLELLAKGAGAGLSPQDQSALLDALPFLDADVNTFAGTISPSSSTFAGDAGLRMVDFRKDGAWKTVVDATPGSSLLGQAATTAGVNLVGNAVSGTTKSDYAQIDLVLPAWYVPGAAISVRVRAKWSTTLLTASSKVDVVAKVAADGSLGSDICTTAAQQVTTSFANYDFVITPTGRVAGETLTVQVALLGDDTGGTVNTAGAISAIGLVLAAA